MADEVKDLGVTGGTAEQKKPQTKTPLTEDEQMAVWKLDEFWGKGGSYNCDIYTGKRTLIED